MPYCTAALSQGARLLRQDPSTCTTTKGQIPSGFYAMAGTAEAGASGSSKGVRYNAGSITTSGEIPAPTSLGATNLPSGNIATRSGHLAGEANMVLGREVIAVTGQGARAAAGSGVAHTADREAAVSSTTALFRPRTVVNKGSVAFTDVAPNSAAVSGMGNGPAAIAWADEVGSMARSWRPMQPTALAARKWDKDV
ncbi:hypothetical protein COO60DRAFT_1634693 [Scenedesmus sp. NREL 46B-D3]|nr:hypothetical protein COO60DRAFT_1634693 [Scenedesmus sp. NREL 46B-D3]